MSRQEQLACIFCGRSIIRDKVDLDKYDNWDIEWKVLQVREMLPGPGRGHKGKTLSHGFPAIPEESLSIIDMKDNPEYYDIVDAIRRRLTKIVRAYIEAGIIDKADL